MKEHLAKVGASCTSVQESQGQAVLAGSSVVECICTPQVSVSFFFLLPLSCRIVQIL